MRRFRASALCVSAWSSAALTLCAGLVAAGPADMFESPGAIAEGKAPDALELKVGDGNVATKTGGYTLSYPIEVPPGRLDAAPSLALSYASQAPLYGSLAAGWSLGLPVIERDFSEGAAVASRWTSSLGGRELIEVAEEADAGWQTFRAQSDPGYARYQYESASGVWRVLQHSGEVFYFGEASYQDGASYGDYMALTRHVDKFGNEVRYHYERVVDPVGDELRIASIEYSVNDAAGLGAHARVLFEYDTPVVCNSGDASVGSQLVVQGHKPTLRGSAALSTIRTQVVEGADFRDVRTYALSYDATASSCHSLDRMHDSPLRLLSGIQQSARSPEGVVTTMPATSFGYGSVATHGSAGASVSGAPSGVYILPHGDGGTGSLAPLGHAPDALMQDMDGDGLDDLVYAVGSPSAGDPRCYIGWKKNLGVIGGDLSFGAETITPMPTIAWANQDGTGSTMLVRNYGTQAAGESCTVVGQHTLEGDPYMDQSGSVPYGSNPPPNYLGAVVIYAYRDMNGDGVLDLVTALEQDPSYFAIPSNTFAGCHFQALANDHRGPVQGPDLAPGIYDPPPTGTPPPATSLEPYDACNAHYPLSRFPWNVYLNDGSGTFDVGVASLHVKSPIPLSKQAGESYPLAVGLGNLRGQASVFVDMDGDGLGDFVHLNRTPQGSGCGDPWSFEVWLFDGQDAAPAPLVWADDDFCEQPRYPSSFIQLGSWPDITNRQMSELVDMNGDGLVDLVWRDINEPGFYVFPNRGFVGSAGGFGAPWMSAFANVSVSEVGDAPGSGNTLERIVSEQLRDLDGDGRPDRVTDSGVYFNVGRGVVAGNPQALPRGQRTLIDIHDWRTLRDGRDVNGDGIPDRIERTGGSSQNTVIALSQPGDAPRGVLASIDNGRGVTTLIRYAPHTDPDVVTMNGATLPNTTWLVHEVQRQHAHGNVPDAVTSYHYDTPVRTQDDEGDWGFRGFERTFTQGPSGAVGETRFSFVGDWSGLQVAQLNYPAGSDAPSSMTTQMWRRVTLSGLDNGIYAYQPRRSDTYRCEQLEQGAQVLLSEADCLAQVTPRVQASTLLPLIEDNKIIAYVTNQTHDGDAIDAFNFVGRFAQMSYDVVYTADSYRIVETREQKMAGQGAGYFAHPALDFQFTAPQVGMTERFYDASLRVVERECSARSVADISAGAVDDSVAPCAASEHDMTTGLVSRSQKPQQRADDLDDGDPELTTYSKSFGYDAHQLFVTSATNEKNKTYTKTVDLGTGVELGSYGPHPGLANERTIDGFGRTLSESAAINSAGAQRTIRLIEYHDDAQPQEVHTKRTRMMTNNDVAATTYNNTYWQEIRTFYDGGGRVIAEQEWNIDADRRFTHTLHDYDASGNLIASSVPDPSQNNLDVLVTYAFEHDSLGRRTCALSPDGSGTVTTYGGYSTRLREIAPDGLGGGTCANPSSTVSAPLGDRSLTSDLFAQLVEVVEATSGADAVSHYTYDGNGHLTSIERPDAVAGDVVTELSHDWLGRRRSVVRKRPGSGDARTWSYLYDHNGNMIVKTVPHPAGADPMAYSTSTVYDMLDRPKSVQVHAAALDGTAAGELGVGTTQMTYWTGGYYVGKLRRVTTPYGTINYEYDTRGNVAKEVRDIDLSGLGLGIDLQDHAETVFYDYTPFGQPRRVIAPTGMIIDTNYARAGNLPARVYAKLDGTGNGENVSFSITRNHSGQTKRLRHYHRVVEQSGTTWLHNREVYYARDSMGRVIAVTSNDEADHRVEESFSYHPTGELDLHDVQVGTVMDSRSFQYGYDSQHQLTHALDDKGYSATFDYSPSGRLTRATVAAPSSPGHLVYPRDVDYVYGSVDPEIVSELTDRQSGQPHAVFDHDEAGQLVSRTVGGQSFDLSYDASGRMRRRAIAGGGDELYYYSGDSRWITVVRDGGGSVTHVRQYLGDSEVQYSCALGSCSKNNTRTRLRLGPKVVGRVDDDGTSLEPRVVHSNGLGHLLAVYSYTTSGGTIDYSMQAAYQYGPFGEILEASGSEANDQRRLFNGKERDPDSGLSYYGYRYYDPLSLTWTRSDPLYRYQPERALADPRRGNLYTFSLNNPVRYVDPDGRDVSTRTQQRWAKRESASRRQCAAKHGARACEKMAQKAAGKVAFYAFVGWWCWKCAAVVAIAESSNHEEAAEAFLFGTLDAASGGTTKTMRLGNTSQRVGVGRQLKGYTLSKPGVVSYDCVQCAINYDMQLAGKAPRSAVPIYDPDKMLDLADIMNYAKRANGPVYRDILGIYSEMYKAGPGARGIVGASRGAKKTGHAFNVINDGGTVTIVDTQSGIRPDFSEFVSYTLVRTD